MDINVLVLGFFFFRNRSLAKGSVILKSLTDLSDEVGIDVFKIGMEPLQAFLPLCVSGDVQDYLVYQRSLLKILRLSG